MPDPPAIDSKSATVLWLSRGRYLRERVAALERSAEAAWDLSTRVTSGISVYRGSDVSRRVEIYPQATEAAERERKRLDEVLREITEAIALVDDNVCATLLQCRYVNCMSWEEIGLEMNYNIRHLHRLHRKAIAELEKVITTPVVKNWEQPMTADRVRP
jgi:hypothetical protein